MATEFPEGEARDLSGAEHGKWPAALTRGPRRALGWARVHRLKAGLVGVVGLVLVGGLAALWWRTGAGQSQGATLRTALEALDAGAYDEARRLAESARDAGLSAEDPLGVPAFVLGSAAVYEADEGWVPDKRSLYLLAARYLEEARDLGFPPEREGEGLFLLGRSLYLSGRMAACRPALREALEAAPQKKTEIHGLLAAAYLEDANPKLPEALEHNATYLADPTLSTDARHKGLLQRAQILLRLGKTSESLSTLDQIPPDASRRVEAIVTRGWVLIHEARSLEDAAGDTEENQLEAAGKYQAAIKTLRLAQGQDTLAAQATRKAMYLIGVCFQELGEDRAAWNQFARTRNKYPGTPEALAADFQVAELSRESGRHDEALAGYRRALKAVADVDEYSNPWLPLDQLRAGILKAYEHYRDAEDFEICLQLTWILYPVFSQARTIELIAETHQLWGRRLVASAHGLIASQAKAWRREGHAQLRRAGRTYQRLANLRATTRHYPDDLWNSAECYLEGKGYQNAVEILQEYLKSQTQRRRPRALLNLGEALLAVGRIDEAISAFAECMRFHPRDAASFQARIAASRAYFEKGEFDRARQLLDENLTGQVLTPKSDEWRESLFSLGQMLHVTGRDEEAVARLEEAVGRYPDSPRATEARYQIADSYYRRAKRLEKTLTDDLLPSARLARSKEISDSLHAALDQYQRVGETLRRRWDSGELNRLEKAMLRNGQFAIGSILFDLEQYADAVDAYRRVASHDQNAPQVLEAYVQISRAYRRLNQAEEARRAVEQARVLLERMKTTSPFEQTTIFARQQWSELLSYLAGQ